MISPPCSPPVWVDRPEDLQAMLADLLQHTELAVDTESNSLYAYREQVCLVQFSTGKRDYLVDSLVLGDKMAVLAPVFANPAILKVFHAAEYDIITLKRDYDFTFVNLFDTMLAGRILGRKEIGLGSMLRVEFGLELDKHFQRANWGLRPLPPAQLAYARLDTYYLLPLRQRLESALKEANRWELALEDFYRISLTQPSHDDRRALAWQVSGSQKLSPRQAAVLQELCSYREQRAALADRPVFKVIGDRTLLEIAEAMPATRQELLELGALSQRQWEMHSNGVLQAVQRGLKNGSLPLPEKPQRPKKSQLERYNRLRDWRKQKGEELGVESDVILPREAMQALSAANPRTLADLAGVMSCFPWRMAQFGAEILAVCQR